MCLGVPMQILAINGHSAHCNANGIRRDVDLVLLGDDTVHVGDFVMVHVGYAIQKIRARDARSAWEAHDALRALADSESSRSKER